MPAYLLQLRDDLDRLESKGVGTWADVVMGLTGFALFAYVAIGGEPPLVVAVFAAFAATPLIVWWRAERHRRLEIRAIQDRIDRIESRRP